ncbi:hypothetical protein [Bradyrhizobium barranii]|uniref:hypothetical protein n=1 Tax=Bradyrhizobium barranii TaxID=2992140 RepID=UPI002AB21469|nr:hypothetical protein [Bradyrhizobium barranii]
MQSDEGLYSAPRWRLTRWLAEPGLGVPDDIRAALIVQLYGSLPVFAAGAVNTIAVAAVIAGRKQTAPFIVWLVMEIAICLARPRRARQRASQGPCPLPDADRSSSPARGRLER